MSETDSRPPGLQHAERLAEDLGLVGDEVDDAVADDRVHGRVGDRQVLDLAEPELDVVEPALAAFRARALDHLGRHVDADDAAAWARRARGEEAVDAAAAAEVEHGLARLQREQRERVAAAEAEVGALGDRGEVVGVVAELGVERAVVQRATLPQPHARPRTRPQQRCPAVACPA